MQELEDRFAIHELLARYARGIDTRDWPVYRAVFTDDATIDYTSAGAMAGTADEVAAALEQGFASIPYSQHYITNVEIQLDGDRAHVTGDVLQPDAAPRHGRAVGVRRLLPPRRRAHR